MNGADRQGHAAPPDDAPVLHQATAQLREIAAAADGFASLWCVCAAISTGAIALHMRYAKPHRAEPYVLT